MKKLILFLLLAGCSSGPSNQEAKVGVLYKKDISIKHNNIEHVGVAVLSNLPSYDLHITAKGELDLFTFENCHRFESTENAWNITEKKRTFIFKKTVEKKKEIKLSYIPLAIEKVESCPVMITALEEKLGRNSWGMIDFEDSVHLLPAEITCNGEAKQAKGVSLCQSKEGLSQQVAFAKKVKMYTTPECDFGQKEGFVFSFNIKKNVCIYVFDSIDKQLHRLTTFGFEEILLRQ